jgi:hypothetical protein
MLNNLKGEIKRFLGICCSKGCKNRGKFDVTIDLGDKKIKRKMCTEHVNKFYSEYSEYLVAVELKRVVQ